MKIEEQIVSINEFLNMSQPIALREKKKATHTLKQESYMGGSTEAHTGYVF